MKRKEWPVEMVEDARELWVKYGGRNLDGMVEEMRGRGWGFYKGLLYTRRHSSGTSVGWVERFGFGIAPTTPSAEAAATPPLAGGELADGETGVEEKERTTSSARRRRGHPPLLRKEGSLESESEIGDAKSQIGNRKSQIGCRRRNAGRHEFERWLGEEFGEWRWNWDYQRFIYERLAAVTAGRCKRLMIFLPPRHGKSELVTIRYVAWRLLREPGLNVILGSYNQRLADKFSRRVRRIVEESEGVEEARSGGDSSASLRLPSSTPPLLYSSTRRLRGVSEWETAGGGVLRAVGVGGGIAGFGAGLIVIDDPVRSRAAAESVNNREKVDDWFRNDIYTRLEPEASIILIQTRWHEDDLAGRLLKEMEDGGERWEVIRLPAIAEEFSTAETQRRRGDEAEGQEELRRSSPRLGVSAVQTSSDQLGRRPGEALCPERYGVKALERIRRKLGGYAFAALYQQRPEPLEGGMFKRVWFKKVVDAAPAGLRWKRGYDLAVSTRTSADYTASFRVAFDRAGNLYIADGFRERVDYPGLRRYIIGRMRSEAMTEHGVESAMHGKAVVQELRTVPELRRFAFREVKVMADKVTRALAWLNLAEEGKVILVRGPWITEFVDEVASFPRGRHDDQIDAVSVAVSMLSVVGGGGRGVMFFD